MGEARTIMDQATEASTTGDIARGIELYAPDAVVVTPDAGELRGAEAFASYFRQFLDAFPDQRYEPLFQYEDGNAAIDEGYFVGTNTGDLQLPTGETLPTTGKSVRVRACDVATVENGRITNHRFDFDQAEFLTQLGLMAAMPAQITDRSQSGGTPVRGGAGRSGTGGFLRTRANIYPVPGR
jgi:predicted ester cyclase